MQEKYVSKESEAVPAKELTKVSRDNSTKNETKSSENAITMSLDVSQGLSLTTPQPPFVDESNSSKKEKPIVTSSLDPLDPDRVISIVDQENIDTSNDINEDSNKTYMDNTLQDAVSRSLAIYKSKKQKDCTKAKESSTMKCEGGIFKKLLIDACKMESSMNSSVENSRYEGDKDNVEAFAWNDKYDSILVKLVYEQNFHFDIIANSLQTLAQKACSAQECQERWDTLNSAKASEKHTKIGSSLPKIEAKTNGSRLTFNELAKGFKSKIFKHPKPPELSDDDIYSEEKILTKNDIIMSLENSNL